MPVRVARAGSVEKTKVSFGIHLNILLLNLVKWQCFLGLWKGRRKNPMKNPGKACILTCTCLGYGNVNLLVDASVEAVRQWKFSRTIIEGKAVVTRSIIITTFSMWKE